MPQNYVQELTPTLIDASSRHSPEAVHDRLQLFQQINLKLGEIRKLAQSAAKTAAAVTAASAASSTTASGGGGGSSSSNGVASVGVSFPLTNTGTSSAPVINAPNFQGDAGSGGRSGSVPAPPAGSAAAGFVLGAGGVWVAPGGEGGDGFKGVAVKTADYTVSEGDRGFMLVLNSASMVTALLPATPPSADWWLYVASIGAGAGAIDPNGLTIDGVAGSLALGQFEGVFLATDGANYFTDRGIGAGSSGPTFVTSEIVSFSGTSGTLASVPTTGSDALYRNGVRQTPGGGNDYTIAGAVITLVVAAGVGDVFLADYRT